MGLTLVGRYQGVSSRVCECVQRVFIVAVGHPPVSEGGRRGSKILLLVVLFVERGEWGRSRSIGLGLKKLWVLEVGGGVCTAFARSPLTGVRVIGWVVTAGRSKWFLRL